VGSDEPVVQAVGVTKRYPNGVTAVNDVDLSVARGEMVGLLGPSGSGKTTLLRMINAALWPTSGTLRVLGEDMAALRGAKLRSHRRRVSTIAQQHSLIPRVSSAQNVLLGQAGRVPLWRMLWSKIFPDRTERAHIYRLLTDLGIGETLDQPVDTLSGGQQQRVAVARALLHGGELIIADEPVASVDQETAEQILSVLRRLTDEEGRTVLVSLHLRPLALRYCTRLVALHRGTLVYDGPPDEAAWRRLPGVSENAGTVPDLFGETAVNSQAAIRQAMLPQNDPSLTTRGR
jgi:phosphonate transport system ATP-binding protein